MTSANRLLLRTAPLAGFGALVWVGYRLMTARLFRFADLVALVTLLVVLYEMHHITRALLKLTATDDEDRRGR